MSVYFYGEDFQRNTFVPFCWDGFKLDEIAEEKWSKLFGWLSRRECTRDMDSSGIAAQCVSGVSAYLTFKFLINELSPKGRHCLVFGCTESVVLGTERLVKQVETLEDGIKKYLSKQNMSVPNGRIASLIKSLEVELSIACKHHISVRKKGDK